MNKGKRMRVCVADNNGFSLIELIVASLITAIISLMVIAFMNITSYSYRNSNAEVSLQMESSISSGLISDLVKEANAYKFTDVTVGTSDYSTLYIATNGKKYLIVADTVSGFLLLKSYTDPLISSGAEAVAYANVLTNIGTNVADIVNSTNKEKYFLAKGITSFNVSPAEMTAIDSATAYSLDLSMKFKIDNRTFVSNDTINFRNGKLV